MSRTLITVTLLSFTGALSSAASHAGEVIDPHQRARDMIAPLTAYSPAPRGAMGRIVDTTEFVDPHLRARQMIHADLPTATSSMAQGMTVDSAPADPHARARRLVGSGRD